MNLIFKKAIKFAISLLLCICSVSLCHATELTHSLSIIVMTPQDAARSVKYTGAIDSAYRIGEIIVIVSNGVHHAFGKGEESWTVWVPEEDIAKSNAAVELREELLPASEYQKCHALGAKEGFYCMFKKEMQAGRFYHAILSAELYMTNNADRSYEEELSTRLCQAYDGLLGRMGDVEGIEYSQLNKERVKEAHEITKKYGNDCFDYK